MDPLKPLKPSPKKRSGVSKGVLRVTRETKRKIQTELARVNKKALGKRIRYDDLLLLALSLIQETHVKSLQDQSLRNADRLQMAFREYCKTSPGVNYDEFLGQLLADKVVQA